MDNFDCRVNLEVQHASEAAIAAVERVLGQKINVIDAPRRAGDPPELISVADRARSVLGWQPQHDDLDLIVRTAHAWEKSLSERNDAAA